MVNDFRDRVKRHFDDDAVGALYLNAGLGQSLRRLHTADDTANAVSILRNNFDIVFAVKRLERGKSLRNFHFSPSSANRDAKLTRDG